MLTALERAVLRMYGDVAYEAYFAHDGDIDKAAERAGECIADQLERDTAGNEKLREIVHEVAATINLRKIVLTAVGVDHADA